VDIDAGRPVSDYFAPPDSVPAPVPEPPRSAPPLRWPGPRLLRAVALVAIVLGIVVAASMVRGESYDREAPLRLPPIVMGVAVSTDPDSFAASPDWRRTVAENFVDSTAYAAASHRPRRKLGDPGPLMANLIAVRGDMTDKLDLRLAAKPFEQLGAVTCTQTLDFFRGTGDKGPLSREPSRVLCWRVSRELSVSILVFGVSPEYVPLVADVVDEVWRLNP